MRKTPRSPRDPRCDCGQHFKRDWLVSALLKLDNDHASTVRSNSAPTSLMSPVCQTFEHLSIFNKKVCRLASGRKFVSNCSHS